MTHIELPPEQPHCPRTPAHIAATTKRGVVKDSFVSSRHIFSVCDDGHLKVPSLDASKEVKLKIITAVLLASQTVALKDFYLAIEMAS